MIKLMAILVSGLMISGCLKPVNLGNRTFVGATRIGEVLQVDINNDQIRFQLEGNTSSSAIIGTLRAMPMHENHLYTLKEKPDLRIAMSHDGLIIYGAKGDYAKFGVGLYSFRKSYQIVDIAGIYNFVVQYCPENSNKFSYGTFEIGADYSWRMWKLQDGRQAKQKPTASGNLVDNGPGVLQAFLDNKKLYANLALSQNSDDIMVINVVAKNGLALGVKKNIIIPGSVNGDYSVLSSNGKSERIAKVQDEVATRGKKTFALNYNEPWEGFIKDSRGEFLSIVSSKGTWFGLNIGAKSGSQFIFAGVKHK